MTDYRTTAALGAIATCMHPESGATALAQAVYRTRFEAGTAWGPGIIDPHSLAREMPRFDRDPGCVGCWAALAVALARCGATVVDRLGARRDALAWLDRPDLYPSTMPGHMTSPWSDPT